MNLNLINLFLLMLLLFCSFNAIIAAVDDPTHTSTAGDHVSIAINCGSSGVSTVPSGKDWVGDLNKKPSSAVQIRGSSTTSTLIHHTLVLDPLPYKTARLSRSPFSYSFQLNPGSKILRLHFNSPPYKGFNRYRDLFSVQVAPFTLLSNFSASLTADALGVTSFVKEFCINIDENQLLDVVFLPAASPLRDTYAFINGIEILPIPPARSYFHKEDIGLQLVGKSPVYIDNRTAIEIIRRLHMKRDYSSLSDSWESVPEKNGNKAKDISWKVSVDVGFRYLIRLHFSTLGVKVAQIGGFSFEVRINGKIAYTSEMVEERDDNSIYWYTDYVVMMKGSKQEGMRELLIGLHSNDEFLDGHEPLTGFEVLKLSNPDNSLASPNPLRLVNDSSYHILQILFKAIGLRNAFASRAAILLVLLNVIVNRLWIVQESHDAKEENMPSEKAGRLCRRFSLAEIQLATHNFSDMRLIGRGGFGKVYTGIIDNGGVTVAVKRLKSNSSQGTLEFLTEIEILTELRHVNLVSLIGYCNECKEMILVYEYMASGTLADHIFKLELDGDNVSSLTWEQRLKICIGAGRALDYLHTGNSIIHRDIKASNILLDENFTAKVADFGLAKPLSPIKIQQTHVSTKVKGTFGYMDPEYFVTGKLTRKSDTYSFGVVLLEVLSGRRASDPRFSIDEQNLIRWAKEKVSKGNGKHIVASNLRGKLSDDSLKAFLDVAERCVHDDPKKRPTMAEVVLRLQDALELQGRSKHTVSNEERNRETSPSDNDHVLTPLVEEQADPDEVIAQPIANLNPDFGRKDQRKAWFPKLSRLWPRFAFGHKADPPVDNKPPVDNNLLLPDLKPVIPFDKMKRIIEISDEYSFSHLVLKDGRAATIKVLRNDQQTDQQFLSQVSKLSSLNHENLVKLLGYSMSGGMRILAYEHAYNGSLHYMLHGDQNVDEGKKGVSRSPFLSWSQRVKIAYGVAKGLEYLHQMGLVHRRIKSKNVLIFNDGEVGKITEFHWPMRPKDPLYYPIPPLETSYRHPVVEGEALQRDVFKFGVVLLELLTGYKPFSDLFPGTHQLVNSQLLAELNNGKMNEHVDHLMNGEYPVKAAEKMVQVATLCVQSDAATRPNMSDVVKAIHPLLNA